MDLRGSTYLSNRDKTWQLLSTSRKNIGVSSRYLLVKLFIRGFFYSRCITWAMDLRRWWNSYIIHAKGILSPLHKTCWCAPWFIFMGTLTINLDFGISWPYFRHDPLAPKIIHIRYWYGESVFHQVLYKISALHLCPLGAC